MRASRESFPLVRFVRLGKSKFNAADAIDALPQPDEKIIFDDSGIGRVSTPRAASNRRIISHLLSGALASGLLVAAIEPEAGHAEISKAIQHAPRVPLTRPEAIIYFANEPDRATLDKSRLPDSVPPPANSDSQAYTRTSFTNAVAFEVRDLMAIALSPAFARRNGAVIFTNEFARRGRFLASAHRETDGRKFSEWAQVTWAPLTDQDPANASNPLSKPVNFARALEAVTRLFPPDQYNFLLIVKSWGTPNLALASVGAPTGTPRDMLFKILGDAGERLGMHFTLVFLDNIGVAAGDLMPANVPENIVFFVSASATPPVFATVDYRHALSAIYYPDPILRAQPSLSLVHHLEALRTEARRDQIGDRPWEMAPGTSVRRHAAYLALIVAALMLLAAVVSARAIKAPRRGARRDRPQP